jgi:uncharacterized protein YrrD
MDDLGFPVAYLAIQEGIPVYDPDGHRIGVVEHVVADEREDIFHGLLVHTTPLPGRHLYADADQIAELRERGVLLSVGRDELREPTEPSAPARQRRPGDPPESRLEAGLRRAWDWLGTHL